MQVGVRVSPRKPTGSQRIGKVVDGSRMVYNMRRRRHAAVSTTRHAWYVGVSQVFGKDDRRPVDAQLFKILLELRGCREVEYHNCGTGGARIPMKWKREIEVRGQFEAVLFDRGRRFVVSIDQP